MIREIHVNMRVKVNVHNTCFARVQKSLRRVMVPTALGSRALARSNRSAAAISAHLLCKHHLGIQHMTTSFPLE